MDDQFAFPKMVDHGPRSSCSLGKPEDVRYLLMGMTDVSRRVLGLTTYGNISGPIHPCQRHAHDE